MLLSLRHTTLRPHSLSALTFAATLTLVACGARAPITPDASAVVEPEVGSVFIVAPHVSESWLGGRWDGAPARLAMGAQPYDGRCAVYSADDAAEDAPLTRVESGANLLVPQAGDAEHVALSLSAWRQAGACRAAGEWHVERVGTGAWMAWSGAPADAADPGAVLSAGGTLLGAVGWTLVEGVWTPGAHVVAAELRRGREGMSGPTACANFDGVDRADALASALLYDRVASPGARARIAGVLREYQTQIGGAAAALLLTGERDQREDLAPLAESPECAASPVWQAAALAADVWAPASEGETADWGSSMHALAAYVALEDGELARAQTYINRALERSPSGTLPRFVSGLLASARELPSAQIARELERAVDDAMLTGAAAYTLGLLAEGAHAPDTAAMWFERSAAADSTFAPPVNALGFLAFESGDFAQARVHFERALERDPEHVGACNNLGYIAERVDGDPLAAERWYRRALEIAPESTAALFNLANVQERWLGALDAARESYAAALRIAPDYSEAAEALAALNARPEAGLGLLAGTWSGTQDDGSTVLASFSPDGVSFVTRAPDGTATTERISTRVAWLRGPQLALVAPGGERVVEMLTPDVIEIYDAETPTHRTRLSRRTGGGIAMLTPR